MEDLEGLRVAIIANEMFEEAEMTEARAALDEAGADTTLISPKEGKVIAARHFEKGDEYEVDELLADAKPEDYDALLLPGGALNADNLRMDANAQEFVRQFDETGKPMAAICHAPWLLVSAGVARGRRLTSYYTIQDDLRNAGADWVDEEVVVDGNLVTSRQPSDIPAFNRAMIALFAESRSGAKELAFRETLDETDS